MPAGAKSVLTARRHRMSRAPAHAGVERDRRAKHQTPCSLPFVTPGIIVESPLGRPLATQIAVKPVVAPPFRRQPARRRRLLGHRRRHHRGGGRCRLRPPLRQAADVFASRRLESRHAGAGHLRPCWYVGPWYVGSRHLGSWCLGSWYVGSWRLGSWYAGSRHLESWCLGSWRLGSRHFDPGRFHSGRFGSGHGASRRRRRT